MFLMVQTKVSGGLRENHHRPKHLARSPRRRSACRNKRQAGRDAKANLAAAFWRLAQAFLGTKNIACYSKKYRQRYKQAFIPSAVF
jgi:hypothetical protein